MNCLWADIPLQSGELGGDGHVVVNQSTPRMHVELHYQNGELMRVIGIDRRSWHMIFDLRFTRVKP